VSAPFQDRFSALRHPEFASHPARPPATPHASGRAGSICGRFQCFLRTVPVPVVTLVSRYAGCRADAHGVVTGDARMRKLIRRLARVAVPPLVVAGVLAAPGVAGAASVTCRGWTGGQPANPGSLNDLQDVAVQSTCSVWAVGDFFNPGTGTLQALTEHWTGGSSWAQVPTPNPSSFGDSLQGVASVSAGNLWAVGFTESATAGASALIEHGNGTSWKVVPSHAPGTDSSLRAVAAASATNIWAVGSTFVPDAGTLVPLILHWNGSRWS